MLLRPIEPEDLQLLYTIENDTELWDVTNNNGPYSHYALKQYIANQTTVYDSGEMRFIIDLSDTPQDTTRPIGIIDLINYSPLNARAEVCIALLKKHRNKGYALKALQQLHLYTTERLRIHTLYALISPENNQSIHLFEKAHYNLIATLPEWQYSGGKYRPISLFQKIF